MLAFSQAPGTKATVTDTVDIFINDYKYFPYCNKFRYLGTIFVPSLKDDADINKQITQAVSVFFVTIIE